MPQSRLAIVSTHPIQYNAPIFKRLAQEPGITIKVFYTLSQSENIVEDVEFGKTIQWDIPLLEGYEYTFVPNISKKPSTKHFKGIQNPQLQQEIENWKADALLVYGWSFKSHLTIMRYFKGRIPVFFRGDSTLLNERAGLKKIARRIFLRWVYHYVDTAFYVGSYNKTYFIAHGLKEQQLIYVPHVIDNERYSQLSPVQELELKKLRKDIGIEGAKNVFLFVGKFIDVKNVFLLLDAFRSDNLLKEVPLLIVGEGHYEKKLKIIAQGEKNIHFLPFQNQATMPMIYRLGTVLILPSKSETWGLAVNEAIASGLAVVLSSQVGCAPEMVREEINGYIFGSEDLPSLKNKLKKALQLSPASITQANKEIIAIHSLSATTSKIAAAIVNRNK